MQKDEYIADINGSTEFVTTEFQCNPGLSSTFPWVSQMAPMFEKYRVKDVTFYYKPQVSQYADTGRAGKVMLSFQYDASLPPPVSKQQVEDTSPVADGMAHNNIHLTLSPADIRMGDSYYIRNGPVPMSADIKTYDFGKLFVSTTGMESVELGNIGELRVRYNFELFDPVLRAPTIAGIQAPPCPPVYCCLATQLIDSTASISSTGVGPNNVDFDKLNVVVAGFAPTCKAQYLDHNPYLDLISPGCYLIDAIFDMSGGPGTGVIDASLQAISGQGNLLFDSRWIIGLNTVTAVFCADANDHGFKFMVKYFPASTYTGTLTTTCVALRVTMVS